MKIKGRIRDMSLVDIIQILREEKKTVGIHLCSEKGYGSIYMKDGELVHASCRDLSGVEALWNLFGWDDGDFEVIHDETIAQQTISEPTEGLMLEGIKHIEEESNQVYAVDLDSSRLISRLIKRLLELGILEKTE